MSDKSVTKPTPDSARIFCIATDTARPGEDCTARATFERLPDGSLKLVKFWFSEPSE